MRMIVAFQKTDQVRHVGHLDLMRTVQRALRRSELPIRYSQGFNPHVVLSFASPLPVGTSGDEELFEVSLATDCKEATFQESLARAMPASLPILRVRAVADTHPKLMASLAMADYRALFANDDAARMMQASIPALLEKQELVALRKTKSGEKPCDIRPMLHQLDAESADENIAFSFRCSLTERETLKPELLLRTLSQIAGVEMPVYRLTRKQLLALENGRAINLMEFA